MHPYKTYIPYIPYHVYRIKHKYHTIPYIALHHTVTLDYATLYYITPCYVTFCYITLRYVTLHYIALRSTTLHCKPIPPTRTRYMIVQGKYITLRCLAWHTHIQNSTCTHTHNRTYIQRMHTRLTDSADRQHSTLLPTYLPTYVHTYIHISIQTYIHCTYTQYTQPLHPCMHTCR